MEMKNIKVLSLFDGISIARQAITNCGIDIEKYYASEIDKYAIQIAQKNFPDTIQLGSIERVYGRESCLVDDSCVYNEMGTLIDIDLIIGGSPCQDLSIAKKNREGLSGARSGLFYEYVRILKEVKPKYFILENVNSMPKEAKQMITAELFGIEPIMINAALVSAQNRKRLFWIGKLVGDTYEQVKIELPEDEGILLKDILEEEVEDRYFLNGKRIDYVLNRPKNFAVKINPDKTNTLRTNYGNASANETYVSTPIKIGQFNKGGQGDRIYSPDGKSVGLSALGGGGGAKTGLYAVTKNYGKWKERADGKSTCLDARYASFPDNHGARTGICCISSNQKHATISEDKSTPLVSAMGMGGGHIPMVYGCGAKNGLYAVAQRGRNIVDGKRKDILGAKTEQRIEVGKEQKAHCITKVQKDSMIMENYKIRKLTPIECERLQSLPDNYTEGVSNTQRYKALGNGFNCKVIEHIIKNISC